VSRDRSTWVALLLADPSPTLRFAVLRDLLHMPKDHRELLELATLRLGDPLLANAVEGQAADGSWRGIDVGRTSARASVWATCQALMRLGYLGWGPDLDAVRRGAEHLFTEQRADGSWPLEGLAWPGRVDRDRETEGYAMIPMQTALPLRALAMCGYATDERSEKGYEWLLKQRLPDGAWPTGIASGNYGGVGGYRRLPHSRWGCRTSTTAALCCLAYHPQRRSSPEAGRALDLLLGHESREREAMGFEVARLLGAEEARGTLTYFARFDAAQVLDLCARVGASVADERVSALVEWVAAQQGTFGLWECRARPSVSRWLTFDLLRALSQLNPDSVWVSLEPRTPFHSYPRTIRRY
jgi:hypothetical protein